MSAGFACNSSARKLHEENAAQQNARRPEAAARAAAFHEAATMARDKARAKWTASSSPLIELADHFDERAAAELVVPS